MPNPPFQQLFDKLLARDRIVGGLVVVGLGVFPQRQNVLDRVFG